VQTSILLKGLQDADKKLSEANKIEAKNRELLISEE
jgi:hypothetical protein